MASVLTPGNIRGLTLWRPFPWAFTHADKRIENRGWAPPKFLIGGYLALHAGKHFDAEAAANMAAGRFGAAARACPQDPAAHPDSVITSVAKLTGWYPKHALFDEDGDPWAFGPRCWRTPIVAVLPEPVPCRGAQGLWVVPPWVLVELNRQLEGMLP